MKGMTKMIQTINGAINKSEFSQDEVIKKIIADIKSEESGEERISLIEEGFCYMLSIEWLRRSIAETNPENFFAMPTTTGELAYYKQIAQNFVVYSEGFKKNEGQETFFPVHEIEGTTYLDIDNHYLGLCTKNALSATKRISCKNGNEFIEAIVSAASPMKYLLDFDLVALEGKKKGQVTGGHEMAILRADDKNIYFFDPNYGVYEIKDANTFFDSLNALYTSSEEAVQNFNVTPVK